MARRQKRNYRKSFRLFVGIGAFILAFGFIVWCVYSLFPSLFPAWFKKVVQITGGFGALLALSSAAVTVILPIRELTREQEAADATGLADSKPIRRVKYETLTARLGKSGKIPWIDRGAANPGLLREHGRVAIVGWMKSGKTREAAEIIRTATEDGTIAAVYEPTSALDLIKQDSLAESITIQVDDRERTLFFIDELGLRPEKERLERLSQCLDTITNLRRDTYCLITIQQERLTDTVRDWLSEHSFYLLELGALNISQRQELVNTSKDIWEFHITPDAVNALANLTDGRPYSIVFTLQQASQETELSKVLVEKLLNQSDEEAWAEQRRNIISLEPLAEVLLESIATFVSAGVTPRASSIKQYACYQSGYKRQRQNVFNLIERAAKRWITFDIVETEGLFTIPEPLVLPLLKGNNTAKSELKSFVAQYKSDWLNTCLIKAMEAFDGAFKTSLWKKTSRKLSKISLPKTYYRVHNFVVDSSTWKRTFGQLIDKFFYWPVDRILLLAELGEYTSRENYLLYNALLEKGSSLINEERYKDAIDCCTKAMILSSNNARAYTYRGQAYRCLEKWEEAIADQNRAVEIDQNYSWIIAQRGITYRLMKRYDDALNDFNRAIELDSKHVWAIAHRGITYRLMKRYDDALNSFNRAIQLDGKHGWIVVQRGITCLDMNQYKNALQNFNQAIKLDHSDDLAIAHRGITYRLMKQYEDALNDFNQAIQLDSTDGWVITHRGITYRLMKQYEDALNDFNRAIELDKTYDLAIAQRGFTYRLMKRYEDALNDFNRAIELDETYDWAIAQRGITYRFIRQYDDALNDFNRAIELDNKDSWVISEKGFTYLLIGNYGDAVRELGKATQQDPEDDWSLYLKSLAHRKLSAPDKALSSLNQAISIADQEYEVRPGSYLNTFDLALYHLANRNIQEAVKYYETALITCKNIYDVETAITDLEGFSKLFPKHQGVSVVLQLLKSKLNELKKYLNGL
ncbi:tetratricopeptide repeat protein [Leptolyngbya cf. ectocarpi LEGE 11479]|uniref:Tetratricopeptide repeat protein n=1 Tax=Leptolyngbya cf. ectocarpi LEGE 11479 TaxID=1828722 RepID=A0A928X2Q7_LEPEC|nr:tetratricopeptide repeat protein [Leptolyngbya ectocarpi]MBE9065973.1 tetratricopeptide repeat protein [Leptolyngbya cf. ectocarpi LEGE 11479]